MRWARNLYTTEETASKKRKIMRGADKGKNLSGYYFVSLASHPDDLLDIFNASQLLQDSFAWNDPYIVGIAEDRGSALELSRVIIDDVYHRTGGFDVRAYFGQKL